MEDRFRRLVVEPLATSVEPHVQVLTTQTRIRNLKIDDPAVVDYLQNIAGGKRELALLHAIEVGILKLMSKRER